MKQLSLEPNWFRVQNYKSLYGLQQWECIVNYKRPWNEKKPYSNEKTNSQIYVKNNGKKKQIWFT